MVWKLKITSMIERGFRSRPADVGLTWCRRVVHSAFNKFENVDVRASQLGTQSHCRDALVREIIIGHRHLSAVIPLVRSRGNHH